MIDPYRVLGVQAGVSVKELKQAWLRKVREAHPDAGGDPAKFKEVTAAYETLIRRAAHSAPSPSVSPVEQRSNRRQRPRTCRGTGQTSDTVPAATHRRVHVPNTGVATVRPSCLIVAKMTDAGLKQVKGLTKLQKLGLSGTMVTDAGLDRIKGLTNLQSLSLGKTQVTDAGLKHLKGLTGLRTLGLIMTNVTDAGLEHLKGLTNLQSLSLGGTRVTDAGLEHLKGLAKLQSLNLMWTKVTDAGLEHLKGLPKLQRLGLSGAKVTDEGIKKLQRALPRCKIKR
jgi:hypothetical protein